MNKFNIVNLYLNSIEKYGSNQLFRLPNNKNYTYNSFNILVNKYKYLFKQYKLNKSDNIIFIGNNSPDWLGTNIASYQLGCNFIPIYQSQHLYTINHIIKETEPKLIICNKDISEKINNGIIKSNIIKYDNINFDKIDEYKLIDIIPNKDDSNLILYTSGTTGLSKGVCLTHWNLMSNIYSIDSLIGNNFITQNDKYFNFLPWSHIYGLNCELYYGISKGASFFINDSINNLITNMRFSEPSIICTVPKLLYSIHEKIESNKISKILTHEMISPITGKIIKNKIFGPNLRFLNSGGASISEKVLNFYKKLDISVYQGYGLSETSPIISLNYQDKNKLGSVGKILNCNDVKIINDEILVRGSNVFSGYYKNKLETDLVFDKDGYFKTGDTGFIDNDNFLYINGRIKDLYKLDNGKYINPSYIENILMESEIIKQIFVYGDNKSYNIALIVSDNNEIEIFKEINKYSDKLNKYEIPKKIIIVPPFTFEDNLLTQKMSVIRKNVLNKYKFEIDKLYS